MAIAAAAEASSAPIIDGSDTDAVWATASPITDFRVFEPNEDGEPRFRTEARVANDAGSLYVFVRAFDPHPDSVISLLSRRDTKTQSDQIKIMVDSYHDRRTGYEFAVNPAGVKRDYYLYDDVREDASWDAVWDVATKIDSLGWTAEFRIPLSQLRYPKQAVNTFGLMIMRDIARTNERLSWPVYRRTKSGVASQFGVLSGLRGLGSPRRLEIVPYAIARNSSRVTANGFGRLQQQSLGADLKYGLSSNLTLDATVNPDFGQVEADPAVLNLTAFESFFEERRPFFVEGGGIFQFDGNSVQLFYPRRIGRAPQLAGLVQDATANIPGSSTILGAAKITGRLSSGTSLGTLAALTQRETVSGTMIEPQTAYGVARLSHDFRKGESGIGLIVTDVNRNLDDVTDDFLRRSATVAGVDARHRFGGGRFSATSSFAMSRVAGTEAAIARTQRSSVHLFQRPDSRLDYDPTRTSLSGTAVSGVIEKVGGVVRGGASYQRLSPGFEPNDIGFLAQADQQTFYTYVSVTSPQPRSFYRRAHAQLSLATQFNTDGMPTARTPELFVATTFRNSSQFSADLWVGNTGPVYCDRCARGGPALRVSPSSSLLINWAGDPRARLQRSLAAIYTTSDGGRSQLWRVRPYLTLRAASNVSMELGGRYQRNKNNTQWYTNLGTIGSPTAHYLFAHLDQHLLSFQTRMSYTATPTLSLQFYAEPFVTTGDYSNIRELASPRAAGYRDRFQPYALGSEPGGFNEKQYRSNMVVRWEYKPGSSVFLVWSQGRDQGDRNLGNFAPGRDYGDLFSARPDNTLLLKASYWLSF
ncbi:MAG TPA: DUF5916 domain-containing protein [Gemmatimonadaceae bacterium]|nr:DUF5916 domain-containing protein [Gemmatimonadaceae bacterium]